MAPKQPPPKEKRNAEEGGRAVFWGDINSPEDDAWADTIWRQMLARARKGPAKGANNGPD